MTEYNLSYTGDQINEAIGKVRDHITPIDTSVVAGSTAAVTGGAIKTELNTIDAKINSSTRGYLINNLAPDLDVTFQNTSGFPIYVAYTARVENTVDTSPSPRVFRIHLDTGPNSDLSGGLIHLGRQGYDNLDSDHVMYINCSAIVPSNWYYKFDFFTPTGIDVSQEKLTAFTLG